MNAIAQYIEVLKNENQYLLILFTLSSTSFILLFIYNRYQINKLYEKLRKETEAKKVIEAERHKFQMELIKLKHDLKFALTHPTKYPIGTKISKYTVKDIEIVRPGIGAWITYGIRILIGGLSQSPQTPESVYRYKLETELKEKSALTELELEFFIINKKPKPTKNGNKKTGKAGIKKS